MCSTAGTPFLTMQKACQVREPHTSLVNGSFAGAKAPHNLEFTTFFTPSEMQSGKSDFMPIAIL
jgi:hypothetical protein